MTFPTIGERRGREIFPLGFGFMRLPVSGGSIDVAPSRAMLERAVESGVNYLDTALPYHGGESELFLGNYLTKEMRDKVVVATKLPTWLIKTPADMENFLNQQLKNLKTDCIDVYLLHALNLTRWDKMQQVDVLEFLEKARAAGKIRYTGFSYHDSLPLFKKIVDAYKWDIVQVQLNILDVVYQAGVEGVKYASAQGAGVVIMEPIKGGMLGTPIEGVFAEIARKYGYTKPTFVDLCLKWVWSHPEINVVLSGMSTAEQLEQNIASANEFFSGDKTLNENSLRLVEEVRAEYKRRVKVGCTGCAYCRPCPRGVDILECFRLYNDASITGNWQARQFAYEKIIFPPEKEEKRASECVQCGICEERCPQNIPIREKLKDVARAFEETVY